MSDRSGSTRPTYGVVVPPGPPTAREGNRAGLTHLLGGILAVVGLLYNLIVVLAIVPSLWTFLANRRRSRYLREEARAALNFQVTWVGVTLILQAAGLTVALLLLSHNLRQAALDIAVTFWLVQVLIAAFDLIVSVIAMSRARNGGGYRYPLSITFVK
jgi:uncharacterized Tic20 family protein